MLARLAALVVLLCLIAFGIRAGEPPRISSPSKLEKTCPFNGAWVPCFIRDEALSQQWNV